MKNIYLIFISIAIAVAVIASIPVSMIKSKIAKNLENTVAQTEKINFV